MIHIILDFSASLSCWQYSDIMIWPIKVNQTFNAARFEKNVNLAIILKTWLTVDASHESSHFSLTFTALHLVN